MIPASTLDTLPTPRNRRYVREGGKGCCYLLLCNGATPSLTVNLAAASSASSELAADSAVVLDPAEL